MSTELGGWIPPSERDREQRYLTAEFHERIQTFGEIGQTLDTLPERVLLHELEIKTLGHLLPRIWQTTGSCVGAASGQAVAQAAVGDVAIRGDHEEIKMSAWLYAYGEGRRIAGMRGRGSGSFGGAQAKAVAQLGILPGDHPRMPKPSPRENGTWIKYPGGVELEWSYSPRWPIPKSELAPESEKYQIGTVTRVTEPNSAKQLLAQGYSITLASMFGIRGKPPVVGDVLLASWNGSWAHQMSCGGYWNHPSLGYLFEINNQWGPNAHGKCPTLSALGVYGSFWVKEATFARIIDKGEVYAHSSTEGFPKRIHQWDHGIV